MYRNAILNKSIRLEELIYMKTVICPEKPFLLQFVPLSPKLISLNNHKDIDVKIRVFLK